MKSISLIPEIYSLRAVSKDDKELIYKMRNMEHVRLNMLNSNIISRREHSQWFPTILNSKDKFFFIFMCDGEAVGVIGFYKIISKSADWSFYIGKEDLPKGAGTAMCALGLQSIFEISNISYIKTMILKENIKSQNIHKKLGFKQLIDSSDNKSLCFSLSRDDWYKYKSNFLI